MSADGIVVPGGMIGEIQVTGVLGSGGWGRTMENQRLSQPQARVWHSLRFRIVSSVVFLALIFGGSAVLVQRQVELRRHDYAILNLSGQLRISARAMTGQAETFLNAVSDGAVNPRQYLDDLKLHTSTFDTIISSFKARELAPELIGQTEALRCTWDDFSRNQLDQTAEQWVDFMAGLKSFDTISPAKRAQGSAQFIVDNGTTLMQASDGLTRSFQDMMEGKLAVLAQTIWVSLATGTVVLVIFILWISRGALRPLHLAISGFDRVARGDLGHQVPVPATTELGQMTRSFNHLSKRLRTFFGLSERINQGISLEESVRFIYEEISPILPLDWIGVLLSTPTSGTFALEGQYGGSHCRNLGEDDPLSAKTAAGVVETGQPLSIENLKVFCQTHPGDEMNCTMAREGLRSVVFLPLAGAGDFGAVLIFASNNVAAYDSGHLEMLGNIAGQMGHSIEKTIVVEDLIVSAVNGLAKLAESRDPETGDHLARMALYSAAVSEQLRRDGSFAGAVTSRLVREIYRFAPMHDIGKVGIEDSVLLKEGKLTEEERRAMEHHPSIGAEVLRRCEAQMNLRGRTVFQIGIEIAESHHERYDGKGYPQGLAGEEIPLSARIVSVCDVFDALTSKRPYKQAWTIDDAYAQIQRDSGAYFDPVVVQALVEARTAVVEIYDRYKHVV